MCSKPLLKVGGWGATCVSDCACTCGKGEGHMRVWPRKHRAPRVLSVGRCTAAPGDQLQVAKGAAECAGLGPWRLGLKHALCVPLGIYLPQVYMSRLGSGGFARTFHFNVPLQRPIRTSLQCTVSMRISEHMAMYRRLPSACLILHSHQYTSLTCLPTACDPPTYSPRAPPERSGAGLTTTRVLSGQECDNRLV